VTARAGLGSRLPGPEGRGSWPWVTLHAQAPAQSARDGARPLPGHPWRNRADL